MRWYIAGSSDRRVSHTQVKRPPRGLLVLSATVAGADDFAGDDAVGDRAPGVPQTLDRYESGIPSHDTLRDVFAALDPELFKACFLAWINDLRDDDADIIAIDGKTSRRSHLTGGRDASFAPRLGLAARQQTKILCSGSRRPRKNPMKSPPSPAAEAHPSEGRSGHDGCHGHPNGHRPRDPRRRRRLLHVAEEELARRVCRCRATLLNEPPTAFETTETVDLGPGDGLKPASIRSATSWDWMAPRTGITGVSGCSRTSRHDRPD